MYLCWYLYFYACEFEPRTNIGFETSLYKTLIVLRILFSLKNIIRREAWSLAGGEQNQTVHQNTDFSRVNKKLQSMFLAQNLAWPFVLSLAVRAL